MNSFGLLPFSYYSNEISRTVRKKEIILGPFLNAPICMVPILVTHPFPGSNSS